MLNASSGLPFSPLLVEQVLEAAIPADVLQIRVSQEMPVVAVAQIEGAVERVEGRVQILQIRVAAREVVVGDRVLRTDAGEAEVALERLVVTAGLRQGLAEHLQGASVARIGFEHRARET